MIRKLFILSILLSLAAGLFVGVGCDKLTTQVNNNNVFDSTLGEDCKRCHGDDDKLIRLPKAQWANSRHASPDLIEARTVYNGENYLTSACGPQCHTSEGFIKYVANGSKTQVNQPTALNCFTCHMPHTGTYGSWRLDTLRGLQATVDLGSSAFYNQGKSNMCAVCHLAAHVPEFSTTPGVIALDSIGADGPHSSAQANIMVGAGGVRFSQATITNSHESAKDKNGCLVCHFGSGVGYDFGEHTFKLLDHSSGAEYITNCNVNGCHVGNPAVVTELFDGVKFPRLDSIRVLGDSLKQLLLAFPILTGADSDSTAFFKDSIVPSDAAKILFNYLLYKKDGSRGVHNARYTLQLLLESVARWDSVPRAIINPSVSRTCTGTSVDFVNASLGSVTNTTWDFGDGSTPSSGSGKLDLPHLFTKSGTFIVKLTIDGSAGRTSTTDTMIIDTVPRAAFSMSKTTLPVDSAVAFTDLSTHGPTAWLWNFGDGVGTSTQESPTYIYTVAGSYEVWLRVSNACGVDSLADTLEVTPPLAPVIGRR